MALASLVMGIAGLTLFPLIGSILAVIFGYMARREIRQQPDQVSGSGLAMAGLVMGWIGLALALLGVVVLGGVLGCGFCAALSNAGSF
jgi:predicted acyltransferase